MKNSLTRTLCTVVFVVSAASAWAQYPTIPAAEKARGERIQAEINRLSDEAWQRALPVVMSEAAKGRPYVPWASKPSDLKQAKIPAFSRSGRRRCLYARRTWRQGNCCNFFS